MNINGRHYRSIRATDEGQVEVIDQTLLPYDFQLRQLATLEQCEAAIRNMVVRGAPLIGATAAYGLALAMRRDCSDQALRESVNALAASRPTAVNLAWALARMQDSLLACSAAERADAAWREAGLICDEDVAINEAIGREGLQIIEAQHRLHPDRPVRVLTHCNAGWLATVDWGTALAPVYLAHNAGIPVQVWVSETRPRNQGVLTAWELGQHGVAHEYVTDNACGRLMQCGLVDMVITGCDRVTASGDVCNKIGTYLKALAARDNELPFYVATPGPTIDWSLSNGHLEIPIEARGGHEVRRVRGRSTAGGLTELAELEIIGEDSAVRNDAFDVTPSRLVTELITERGRCAASSLALAALYPQQARAGQATAAGRSTG